jgi:hypothetical protein
MPKKFVFLLMVSGYALSAFAQSPLGESYWQLIRSKADSIVIQHFGQAFFDDHIFFDPEYEINYIAFAHDHSCGWQDRDTVTQVPEFCHFEYLIGFDVDNNVRMIEVALQPDGTLVSPSYDQPPSKEQIEMAKEFSREVLFPLQEFYGFTECNGGCSFKYDLRGFRRLAQEKSVKCRRSDSYTIHWISPDSASWANGERYGRYELEIACRVGKGKTRSADGVIKNYLIQSIVFDPFSGDYIRTDAYTTPRKIEYINLCRKNINEL